MARLIIGCGRTEVIHYNPLFVDPDLDVPQGEILGWDDTVFYTRGHDHAPRGPHGDVLMDVDPLMHPDFVGSINDPDNELLNKDKLANFFTDVIFENIPADVFSSNTKCKVSFNHAFRVLQAGGRLSLRTGASKDEGSAVRTAIAEAGFRNVQINGMGTLTALK